MPRCPHVCGVVVVVVLAALPTSCMPEAPARPQQPWQQAPVAGQIESGRSTPHDVLALLGEPDSRMRDANGLVQWVYWSTEEAGGRYAHTRIVVEFGPDGTVRRVASSRVAP
jgi:hypothetical protein